MVFTLRNVDPATAIGTLIKELNYLVSSHIKVYGGDLVILWITETFVTAVKTVQHKARTSRLH